MEQEVCKAHSGLEAKIEAGFYNLNTTLKSMDERLTRIEGKIEPISTIGHMAEDNRKWLSVVTAALVTYAMKLLFWR